MKKYNCWKDLIFISIIIGILAINIVFTLDVIAKYETKGKIVDCLDKRGNVIQGVICYEKYEPMEDIFFYLLANIALGFTLHLYTMIRSSNGRYY